MLLAIEKILPFVFEYQCYRAQVHIRGYGVVHTEGAEFEARKRRKVDLISFDMVNRIKIVKFECTTEHSNISSYTVTRFTPRNSVQKCMNTSTIFDNIVSANRFARLLMKKIRYSNISHSLTCMIAFKDVDYI